MMRAENKGFLLPADVTVINMHQDFPYVWKLVYDGRVEEHFGSFGKFSVVHLSFAQRVQCMTCLARAMHDVLVL